MTKPTIWYYAVLHPVPRIEPVPVLRETEHTIVRADQSPSNARRRKEDGYFKTWKEAWDNLLSDAGADVSDAEVQLTLAQDGLDAVRKLKP